ncbi:hypothetical protein [Salipiger sp. PrR003]|uniref:hypothetical protein n=1 Tax=Salipiger sp. PrR003 TaxID=2706776 RepID=UPI0013DB6AFE|nr:hypothetical protein [Salipiger sp. PrR003]NDV50583.1 hypothetical protein [Salipiger sp. PrR003]
MGITNCGPKKFRVEGGIALARLCSLEVKEIDWRRVRTKVLGDGEKMEVPSNSIVLVRGDLLYDFGTKGGAIEGPVAVGIIPAGNGAIYHALLVARVAANLERDHKEARTKRSIGLTLSAAAGLAAYVSTQSVPFGGAVAVGVAVFTLLQTRRGVQASKEDYIPSERQEVMGTQEWAVDMSRPVRSRARASNAGTTSGSANDMLMATALFSDGPTHASETTGSSLKNPFRHSGGDAGGGGFDSSGGLSGGGDFSGGGDVGGGF